MRNGCDSGANALRRHLYMGNFISVEQPDCRLRNGSETTAALLKPLALPFPLEAARGLCKLFLNRS